MNEVMISAGDTAWVMVSSALVLLMVAGLALFYGGLVSSRSMLNTMMMSAAAFAVVGVQWVVLGYSIAFSEGSSWFGGLGFLGLSGVTGDPGPYSDTIPHVVFAAFQGMFAVITAALISGAVVERMKFKAYLLFILLWTTIVYDPLAHWVWGGGWIGAMGALDFAGGTVVHISAGVSAIVAALMLGTRRDYGKKPFIPHNVPLTLLGAALLWFGWFGFNAGSALAADGVAANAFMTTFAAPAAALGAWMIFEMLKTGRPTAVGAATAIVVGLVAITPAAGFVTPLGAVAIGIVAAGASYLAIQLRARTRLDDSLDVFACHGTAGIVGAILTGVFATTTVNPGGADGLLYGNPGLVATQTIAVVATIVFVAIATGVVLLAVRAVAGLRVSLPDELAGIDLAEHGESAYHGGDLATLPAVTGRRVGESVVIPAAEVARFQAAAAPGK